MIAIWRESGGAPTVAHRQQGVQAMDSGGFNWTLITIVGAIVLAVVIAWAALRNRSSRSEIERSEEATRSVYEEEERAHHGESDNVP
jgi:hypothetical protein